MRSTIILIAVLSVIFFGVVESKVTKKCEKNWITRDTVITVDCYFYGDKPMKKFVEARDFCRKQNSNLVSIKSYAENSFLTSKKPSGVIDAYWIGYVNDGKRDLWIDDTEIFGGNYTNWAGTSGACIKDCNRAILDSSGKWKKVSEEYSHGARPICKSAAVGIQSLNFGVFFALTLLSILGGKSSA